MEIPLDDCYAAIDIGASSGRVVIGYLDTDSLTLDPGMKLLEIHRFENSQKRVDGHDCWKLDMLFEEIVSGLSKCKEMGFIPKSIGIDTWGVDFVLLDENDQLLGEAVSYRDSRTDGIYEVADKIMPAAKVYGISGIQRLEFNTIYQLLALKRENPDQLDRARTFLMVPDYLAFLLTGKKANEYTNATTTGLVNAETGEWDETILDAFGFAESIFLPPALPGSTIGSLKAEIADRIGFDTTLVLPATHDTGSAFLAVPAQNDDAVFLSSGTWSLLGVENPMPITSMESLEQGFTNEGGYARRFRYLKNIMGLWMIQSIRRELNGIRYIARDEGTSADQVIVTIGEEATSEGHAGGAAADKSISTDSFNAAVGESAVRSDDAKSPYLDPLPEVATPVEFGDLIRYAEEASDFFAEVDVNDSRFLAPGSMIEEIRIACYESGQPVPNTVGELMRCVYISLADCYRKSIENLSDLTGRKYTSINIVGGGCQDAYLNQITADKCRIPVFAGPIEGTSIGNIAVQMLADNRFEDVQAVRDCIRRSFDVVSFEPQNDPE